MTDIPDWRERDHEDSLYTGAEDMAPPAGARRRRQLGGTFTLESGTNYVCIIKYEDIRLEIVFPKYIMHNIIWHMDGMPLPLQNTLRILRMTIGMEIDFYFNLCLEIDPPLSVESSKYFCLSNY